LSSENPYCPPNAAPLERDAAWYLASAQRYLQALAWVVIALAFTVMPALQLQHWWAIKLANTSWWPPVFGIVAGFNYAIVTLIAKGLRTDFDQYYRRARWWVIILGVLFFPLLTWPAFVAMQRLAKCRALRNVSSSMAN
jgi:hypothetical protein